jgi:hypothetical protein
MVQINVRSTSGLSCGLHRFSHDTIFVEIAFVREQGDMAGAFDGASQGALMTGAGAGLSPWPDLAAFENEAAKHLGVFIIDFQSFFRTELANPGSGDESPPAGSEVFIIFTHG